MKRFRRGVLVVSALFLAAATARGQTVYSWDGPDGRHYTDDVSQVPKGAGVKVEVVTFSARPRPSPPQGLDQARPEAVATVVEPRGLAAARSSGEPDERSWRDRFIDAHRRIQALQASIHAMELNQPSMTLCTREPVAVACPSPGAGTCAAGPSLSDAPVPASVVFQLRCVPNPEYERMRLLLAQKKVDLGEAQRDLEQLERRASQESVPREWRRGW